MLDMMRGGAVKTWERHLDTVTRDLWCDTGLPEFYGDSKSYVFFAPRACTHWPVHHGGQYLTPTVGEEFVGDTDGGIESRVVDNVWIPGGPRYWHGTSAQRFVINSAVSVVGA